MRKGEGEEEEEEEESGKEDRSVETTGSREGEADVAMAGSTVNPDDVATESSQTLTEDKKRTEVGGSSEIEGGSRPLVEDTEDDACGCKPGNSKTRQTQCHRCSEDPLPEISTHSLSCLNPDLSSGEVAEVTEVEGCEGEAAVTGAVSEEEDIEGPLDSSMEDLPSSPPLEPSPPAISNVAMTEDTTRES